MSSCRWLALLLSLSSLAISRCSAATPVYADHARRATDPDLHLSKTRPYLLAPGTYAIWALCQQVCNGRGTCQGFHYTPTTQICYTFTPDVAATTIDTIPGGTNYNVAWRFGSTNTCPTGSNYFTPDGTCLPCNPGLVTNASGRGCWISPTGGTLQGLARRRMRRRARVARELGAGINAIQVTAGHYDAPTMASAYSRILASRDNSSTPYSEHQGLKSTQPMPVISQPASTYWPAHHAQEPTMVQLLAQQQQQPTRAGAASPFSGGRTGRMDIDTLGGNAAGLASWRKGQGFKGWESEQLRNPEVRRKADVAQLFFLDYYFDLIHYVGARKARTQLFKEDVLARGVSGPALASEWSSYCGRERVLLRKRRTKLRVEQFHIITQVGQGGYGEVYLARKRETSEICALKKMRKRTLAKMDEIRHVLVERDILTATKTPWLVKLLYAFQDQTHVYLAMEYVPGGDFRTLLNNSGVLKEEHARFYSAEMFCAVNALHTLGYIHRDLKPENFLIDRTGHIKLTDFGLAAGALNPGRIENLKHKLDEVKDQELIFRSTVEMRSIYKTMRMADPRYADSVVGSPDYMAPETLRGQNYTYTVDFWSLGAVLFEFLAGFPPFSGASPDETWNNLRQWRKYLRRPHYDRPEDRIFNLSDEGWSAITALLEDKARRLSSLNDVKAHPFFRGVQWETLRDGPAPFVPALDSETDAGYFDNFEDPADMAKYAEVKEKQRNVDAVREKEEPFNRGIWVGFTFKSRGKIDPNEVVGIVQDAGSPNVSETDGELLTMW